MVYFAIFDPARKIKQLVQLFHRSRRHQDQARSCRKTSILDHALPKHDVYPFTLAKESAHSLKGVEHDVIDDVYYARGEETRGSETEYCTLKIENTLFKVHKSVLMRDDSVFMDWKFVEGGSLRAKDKNAPVIHLPENAFPFRDLLWALHNLDLEDTSFVYEPSLARLLNVAELSRKYRFSSYEAWAVDRLHAACQGTTLPFSLSTALASSSSITLTEHVHSISTDIDSLCARLLNVAYASRHSPLLLLMMKKLVVQILWHDYHPGAILFDAVEALSRRRSRYQRHIRQLLGVIYYRMLVDMQYATASDKSPILVFPLHMDVEQRMRFLSAHRSLTEMWVNLKYSPLVGPTSHGTCQATWDRRWRAATRHAELSFNGKAGHTDVLGLLKATMIHLRKSVADSNSICLECSLAGLESIDAVRDDIINNLGDLFVYT